MLLFIFISLLILSWFPGEEITEYPLAIGNDITLIAGFQLRNNARVMFISSLDFLSNHMAAFKSAVMWNDATHKIERYSNANQKLIELGLDIFQAFILQLERTNFKSEI